ncbi:FKBP-type peptidyl-prolyl cis-trans isomerase [Rufibacter roseus]|uniref:Peptidyl-prolyl cis-trans isomerase n=1 Tax=Rufibacter roseus TaxID=1567108 RepID=A0ABW2DH57_9BACT|nr:FKBP-type peptidyl-prolyl cis-trans isomerase [Rufibacter roseus]
MQRLVRKSNFWQWILAVCCVLTVSSCADKDPYDPYANFDHAAQAKWEDELILQYLETHNITDYTRTPSGLYYVIQEEGTGARPVKGDQVEVNYVGRLVQNSRKFDSSYDRAETFKFVLGMKQVITGWDEGVQLMRKGEKAMLLIPSRLAYGLYGSGQAIPPNSPIMFEVHLISF